MHAIGDDSAEARRKDGLVFPKAFVAVRHFTPSRTRDEAMVKDTLPKIRLVLYPEQVRSWRGSAASWCGSSDRLLW